MKYGQFVLDTGNYSANMEDMWDHKQITKVGDNLFYLYLDSNDIKIYKNTATGSGTETLMYTITPTIATPFLAGTKLMTIKAYGTKIYAFVHFRNVAYTQSEYFHIYSNDSGATWSESDSTTIAQSVAVYSGHIFKIGSTVYTYHFESDYDHVINDFGDFTTRDENATATDLQGISGFTYDDEFYILGVQAAGAYIWRTWDATNWSSTAVSIPYAMGTAQVRQISCWRQGNLILVVAPTMLAQYNLISEEWKVIGQAVASDKCGVCVGYDKDDDETILKYLSFNNWFYKVFENGGIAKIQELNPTTAYGGWNDFINGYTSRTGVFELQYLDTYEGVDMKIRSAKVDLVNGTCKITDHTSTNVWDIDEYMILTDNSSNIVFEGEVRAIEYHVGGIRTITIESKSRIDLEARVTASFTAEKVSDIIDSIINANCDYLTQHISATTNTYDISFVDRTIKDILYWAASLEGYVWYMTPTLQLYYNDGTVDSGLNITNSDLVDKVHYAKDVMKKGIVQIFGDYVDGVRISAFAVDPDVVGGGIFRDAFPDIKDPIDLQAMADKILIDRNKEITSIGFLLSGESLVQYGEQMQFGYTPLAGEITISGYYYIKDATYDIITDINSINIADALFVTPRGMSTSYNNEQMIGSIQATFGEQARDAINDVIGSDGKLDSDLDADSHKITNLSAPTSANDAARLTDIPLGYYECRIVAMNGATNENFGAVKIALSTAQYLSYSCKVKKAGNYYVKICYQFATRPSQATNSWKLRVYTHSVGDDAVASGGEYTVTVSRNAAAGYAVELSYTIVGSVSANTLVYGYWYNNGNTFDQDMKVQSITLEEY